MSIHASEGYRPASSKLTNVWPSRRQLLAFMCLALGITPNAEAFCCIDCGAYTVCGARVSACGGACYNNPPTTTNLLEWTHDFDQNTAEASIAKSSTTQNSLPSHCVLKVSSSEADSEGTLKENNLTESTETALQPQGSTNARVQLGNLNPFTTPAE